MVLKAKGRKKRLKTGGSNCLPTTRTSSSILKTTMFFPHLSFFYCYSYRLTDCLLGIAENSDLILFRLFFCGLREKLVNERDINNFMFFRFFITFWCAITPETNEVNLMFIISTEICTCVVKIQSIQALHNLDFRIFLKLKCTF